MDATDIVLTIVFIILGLLELVLTYQYNQKVKERKITTTTAPLVIWSGIVIGVGLIIVPFAKMFSGIRYINRGFSIFCGILFLIAAVWTLIRAINLQKNLKENHEKLTSSWETIGAYIIVIVAAVSGISSLL